MNDQGHLECPNVAKNAGAPAVEVDIECNERVALRVLDDGCGMPVTLAGGYGIGNVTERAAQLGGGCRVSAQPDGGTMLEWQVPSRV
jgi:signal transduction histidine kinase